MKSILITGGAGFIGSNFIPYLMNKYHDYFIINLDKLTYAGNLNNLIEIKSAKNYKFIKGDITNRNLVKNIFKKYNIHDVIHFAAESHVDNSIKNPDEFIKTNINGTFILLDAARSYWLEKPFQHKKGFMDSIFQHVSTDEVYGTLGSKGFFTENTPYAPNSPYSASKASSDMIARSYHHTYGLNVKITNCSNNFGPKQHDEKLIPTIIRNALKGNPIPIYGDGKNVRDWLYVMDHCMAIDLVFHKGKTGNTYNVGTRNEIKNIDLAKMICDQLDKLAPKINKKSYHEQITFVADRPGHDKRYAIDPTRIEKELGFKAEANFTTGLKNTVKWYLSKYDKN